MEQEEKQEMEVNSDEGQVEVVEQAREEAEEKPEVMRLLREEVESLREELEQEHDRLLRLAAEFDNYKKRVARDFETLVRNANENLIVELLPVLDNLERALESGRTSVDFSSFYRGVEMIFQQLWNLLEKQGLRRIQAVGDKFDPNRHEALMQVESDQYPPDVVVDEIQKGYMLHDKVLRPSRVIVSK